VNGEKQQHGGSIAYVTLLASVAALGGLLFGYDTAVISGAIGFLETHFKLDPLLSKGWAAASALLGCAAGAALAGPLSDGLGRRQYYRVLLALVLLALAAPIPYLCYSRLAVNPLLAATPLVRAVGWAVVVVWGLLAVWFAIMAILAPVINSRKKVLILCALLFLASAIGTALAHSFPVFIVFRIIGGLAIGAASISSPMYIAEISPARIRGRMVSVNQFAIVSGMVLVYFVNYFIAGYGTHIDQSAAAERPPASAAALDPGRAEEPVAEGGQSGGPEAAGSWNAERGWRWMFGSGTLPAVLLLLLLLTVPESPRWLTKQQRRQEALAVLTRLSGPAPAERELADIEDALAHETGSLRQLFMPGMRLALLIGVTLAVLQQVTGINVFLYYAPEIFKKLGSETSPALLQTVLVGAVNFAFTVIAIWTVDRLGRKPLMLIGSTGMGVALVAMGVAAYLQQTDVWVLMFILGYIACFALSVGPVTWVILSEIFPTRIRGRAMALATVCLWFANFVVTQTFTMMDEDAWLIAHFRHAFPFWVYALLCAVSVAFVWQFVPETKGKTLEDIERGWLRGEG